jgi:dTDP-4-dehydrorhamnose reductase
MKILVTGNSGFLSKEIREYFQSKYDLSFIGRTSSTKVDLLNKEEVNNYFKSNKKFDVIIHTAASGAKRTDKNEENILHNNLLMYNNLIENKDSFNYFFNFCSGAALRKDGSVSLAKEEDIFSTEPIDFYGISKNKIARDMKKYENFYNFRIFGCFGRFEEDSRFFKSILNCISQNKPFVIHQDKYMDYISAIDLCKIVEFYIENVNNNTSLPKDINFVYNTKKTLTQMCKTLCDLTDSNPDIILMNENFGNPYTGSAEKLNNLNIELNGFDLGLTELIQHVFRR